MSLKGIRTREGGGTIKPLLHGEDGSGRLAPAVVLVDSSGNELGSATSPLVASVGISEAGRDAFGRQRVSDPETLFDSKQIFDNAPFFWDEALESGAGISSTHNPDEAATTITSTLSTAGKFTRQTFMSFNYQPGKSQFLLMTGNLDKSGGGTGVQRRIGQFNDDNGLFFEDNEGIVNVVVRSSYTGSAVDIKIPQSSWNLDQMDGLGSSGITTDWTKGQIFVIDYEWLGVGRIRFGLVANGLVCYVHEIDNANVLAGVYMSSPNLPLRYQMVTTAASPASSMCAICATIISEGGNQILGMQRSANTSGTHLDANIANELYALLGIRLKSTHVNAVTVINAVSVICETNDDFEWGIYLNPVVAGTFTYSDETNSAIQVAKGATANTVSGGTLLISGYAQASASLESRVTNARYLGAAIDGTVDEIILTVRPLGASADVQGAIVWTENT